MHKDQKLNLIKLLGALLKPKVLLCDITRQTIPAESYGKVDNILHKSYAELHLRMRIMLNA